MTDNTLSGNGQINSARFYLNDKPNINLAVVFSFLFSSVLFFTFTHSVLPAIIFLSVNTAAAFFKKNIYYKILIPVWNYRIFLLFSFLFSFLMSHDLLSSSRLSLKFIVLISLSIWMNYLIDFKELLFIIDKMGTKVLPAFIQLHFIKTVKSLLLSIEYTLEMISHIRDHKNIKTTMSADKSFIRKNTEIFLLQFNLAFSKARDLEIRDLNSEHTHQYSSAGYQLSRSDIAGIILSLTIVFLIPFSS